MFWMVKATVRHANRCGLTCLVLGAIFSSCFLVPSSSRAETSYELETARELSLAGGTALLFGLGWWADSATVAPTPKSITALDPADLPGVDRGAVAKWSRPAARLSDVMRYTTLAAPLTLLVTGPGSREPGRLGLIYLETMLLSEGATYLLKSLVARTRPYVYNSHEDIPLQLKLSRSSQRSFPSGHTSGAFASMVFLAGVYDRLHPDSASRAWVWGGCLAAASLTGYLRYEGGRHFPTDILAGALIGAAAGWLVPRLHEVDLAADPAPGASPPLVVGMNLRF